MGSDKTKDFLLWQMKAAWKSRPPAYHSTLWRKGKVPLWGVEEVKALPAPLESGAGRAEGGPDGSSMGA